MSTAPARLSRAGAMNAIYGGIEMSNARRRCGCGRTVMKFVKDLKEYCLRAGHAYEPVG